MKEAIIVELRVGRDGPARAWSCYLPRDSRVTEEFYDPVNIVLKGGVMTPGLPPENPNPGGPMKIYAGARQAWISTDGLIDTFAQLWPEVLECIAGLGSDVTHLVYFSSPATDEDLYSLWPYMPFGSRDDERFFVSEAYRDTRVRLPLGWVCVEYAYDNFKRMTRPDGFGFRYGTTIMGVSVSNAKVDEYLRMKFLDQDALEKGLGSSNLRCWWFCDADFEGMTIWHKDISAPDLLARLRHVVRKAH